MKPRAQVLLAMLAAAATVAGCGGNDKSGDRSAASSSAAGSQQRVELEHIHGLGVDPASGRLLVATHFGLYGAGKGQTRLQRLGPSRQDIMGFSVIGARHFIGSGHPDPSQNLPPNLGLIESRDGGQTWKNISLSGQADFHVLRSAGRQVYGFDGGSGQLMVSNNGGRDWAKRTPPAGVFDLAIDPRDSRRIVISTEQGIYASANAGKGWEPVRGDIAGLLVWPAPERLLLIDGQGQVSSSTDAGKTFHAAGSIGGQPAAFASYRDELYAARGDGSVVRSTDGGASWSVRATP